MIVYFKENRRELIYNLSFVLFFIILFSIAASREIGFDRDSIVFAEVIYDFLNGEININLIDKEPTFWLIILISDYLFSDPVSGVFIIYSAISISIKLYVIKKLSLSPFLSIIVYISLYYILHELTQFRIGVAAAFFLLSIDDIYKKNFKGFLLKYFLAILFHYSAVIIFPLYFINQKKKHLNYYYFLPVLALLISLYPNFLMNFIKLLIPILPIFLGDKLDLYFQIYEQGVHTDINLFNFYILSLIFIYYFALYFSGNFKSDYDIIHLKIMGIMIFSFYTFAFLPVLSFRISEFLGVILIIFLANLTHIFDNIILAKILLILYSSTMLYNYLFIQNMLRF